MEEASLERFLKTTPLNVRTSLYISLGVEQAKR